MNEVLEAIMKHRLVIIYRGTSPAECLEASQALFEAGVSIFEVTLNTPGALEALELLREGMPAEASVGAGTVLTATEVEQAADAGAEFIISPTIEQEVIEKSKELGLVSIPGAFTPTEVQRGWALGADIVKVFPINAVGANYLTQIRGPLDQIPLMPTGKVDTPEFVTELFRAGASAVGVGAHLLGRDLLAAKNWEALKSRAGAFLEATKA